MSDFVLRTLERAASLGDREAIEKLARARRRAREACTEFERTLPAEDPEHHVWERDRNGKAKPVYGAGATVGVGSDSYPYTVYEVSDTGHQITLRADGYRVISGSFQTGDAQVSYFWPDREHTIEATRRRGLDRNGRPIYVVKGEPTRGGSRVYLGQRRFHRDPHI